MQVNKIDNTAFTSRRQTIRFADDIARKSHILYDTVSGSRLACYKNYKQFEYLRDCIFMRTSFMRKMKDKLYNCADNFYKKIEALINPTRLYKVANCGEQSHIASIMAKVNGIKNCHIAHLYKSNGKDLDHAVVYVNDEKPYIIDGWLGFADYVPNALKRYQKEYKQFFDIEQGDSIGFASKYDDEFTDLLKDNFTKKQIKTIKRLYPEMKIVKNKK